MDMVGLGEFKMLDIPEHVLLLLFIFYMYILGVVVGSWCMDSYLAWP